MWLNYIDWHASTQRDILRTSLCVRRSGITSKTEQNAEMSCSIYVRTFQREKDWRSILQVNLSPCWIRNQPNELFGDCLAYGHDWRWNKHLTEGNRRSIAVHYYCATWHRPFQMIFFLSFKRSETMWFCHSSKICVSKTVSSKNSRQNERKKVHHQCPKEKPYETSIKNAFMYVTDAW